MTDRSKIIRHPDVVREEFRRIGDEMAMLRVRIAALSDELEQVANIAYEMMTPQQEEKINGPDPL